MLRIFGANRAQAGDEIGVRDGESPAGSKQFAAASRTPHTRATFKALYRRYVAPVYSYIYSRVGEQAEAEDLTGQVFMEVLEGMERYEEQGKSASWIFTIAHRRVVDHYRSRRQELPFDEALDSPRDGPNPEREIIRQEQLAQLARLVANLDEEQRALLQLRFVAELTYGEIGEVVGSSEGAVKKAIYRLLDRLRTDWTVADLTKQAIEEAAHA